MVSQEKIKKIVDSCLPAMVISLAEKEKKDKDSGTDVKEGAGSETQKYTFKSLASHVIEPSFQGSNESDYTSSVGCRSKDALQNYKIVSDYMRKKK